nr:hypothetical protein [Tanacetum cinerariifolium]
MINSLDMGIPPRQITTKQSASSKLNLARNDAVAYMEYIFYFLEPLSQTEDSLSTLKVKELAFQEVAIASAMPWAINPLIATSVIVNGNNKGGDGNGKGGDGNCGSEDDQGDNGDGGGDAGVGAESFSAMSASVEVIIGGLVIGQWMKHQQVRADAQLVYHRQMELNTLDTQNQTHNQMMVVPPLETAV